ncbi:MAG: tyrosine-type recombinase/integrase, partial [Neisseriaceae bacterium]
NAFKKHKATNYEALAPHQIPLLLEKLDMGHCSGITRYCLYFQLYSLSRPSEATNALKSEIDLEAKQWVQSAEKMKMRKEHVVPLSNQMMTLITELLDLDLPGPYLFPGQSGNAPLNSETLRAALRRMKLPTTAHGFRALGSTALNESGLFRDDVIERALSHVERNKTRAAYNRAEYIEERTVMLQWWADYLDSQRA